MHDVKEQIFEAVRTALKEDQPLNAATDGH
jgi:hypothetical protein